MQTICVRADDITDPAPHTVFAHHHAGQVHHGEGDLPGG
jgi:F0F1-type ATP synthase beta subunit